MVALQGQGQAEGEPSQQRVERVRLERPLDRSCVQPRRRWRLPRLRRSKESSLSNWEGLIRRRIRLCKAEERGWEVDRFDREWQRCIHVHLYSQQTLTSMSFTFASSVSLCIV